MKLKELIAELEYLHDNGNFEECESVGEIELSFKLMVKNTDLQDDDIWDIDLSKPEIICSSGSFFVEYGTTIENNIPNKDEWEYYFKNVHPNEEELCSQ